MAIAVRGGSVAGVVFHTDQGGEYTGGIFVQACRRAGVTQSMGRTRSALDTPVILAAGVLKIPDLTGPLGLGITGQILVGSAASFVSAYLSVRFLERSFRTRTLIPFAIYSLIVGAS